MGYGDYDQTIATGAALFAEWLREREARERAENPNFKPVPLTPEDQWRFDRQRETYDYSPTRDFISSYAYNWLQGINGPNGLGSITNNHRFMSPHMQGQQLAGGFRFPTIDMTNFPTPWDDKRPGSGASGSPGNGQQQPGSQIGAPGAGAPSPGPYAGRPPRNNIGGTGDPNDLIRGPRMPETWGGRNVETPGNYRGVTDPNTRNPFIGPDATRGPNAPGAGQPGTGNTLPTPTNYTTNFNDIFSHDTPPPGVTADPSTWQSIRNGWNSFVAATPGWARMGINAIVSGIVNYTTGIPAPVVYNILKPIFNSGQNPSRGSGFIEGSISGQRPTRP